MSSTVAEIVRYTDEGLRVVLAEDWYIYVVREEDGLMFQYVTELWFEWGDVCAHCYLGEQSTCTARKGGHTVADLIPYAHDHKPRPILSDSGIHMTLDKFLAADYA